MNQRRERVQSKGSVMALSFVGAIGAALSRRFADAIFRLRRSTKKKVVIPAYPGWAVLERITQICDPDDIVGLNENPVIAWAISIKRGGFLDLRPNVEVDPICAENPNPEWERPILRPDGHVIGRLATWATKDAYLSYLQDPNRNW